MPSIWGHILQLGERRKTFDDWLGRFISLRVIVAARHNDRVGDATISIEGRGLVS